MAFIKYNQWTSALKFYRIDWFRVDYWKSFSKGWPFLQKNVKFFRNWINRSVKMSLWKKISSEKTEVVHFLKRRSVCWTVFEPNDRNNICKCPNQRDEHFAFVCVIPIQSKMSPLCFSNNSNSVNEVPTYFSCAFPVSMVAIHDLAFMDLSFCLRPRATTVWGKGAWPLEGRRKALLRKIDITNFVIWKLIFFFLPWETQIQSNWQILSFNFLKVAMKGVNIRGPEVAPECSSFLLPSAT